MSASGSAVMGEQVADQLADVEGEVLLHSLCEVCKSFCQTWDVLNENPGSHEAVDGRWKPSFMCTVAHLVESYEECHFCNLVWTSSRRFPNVGVWERSPEANVYLQVVVGEDGVLVVHVRLAHEVQELEERGKVIAAFILGSYKLSDMEDGFARHITATQVPLLARDNIYQAKAWIETCSSRHQRCRKFQSDSVASPQRPTRVLSITSSSVTLCCDMADVPFDYLVLSHIWGTSHDQQIKLLSENVAAFQAGIPHARLNESVIYTEAIRITRLLGYQYLWIDSLCIIQDSRTDWDYEASRMAIVYGNAVCNIASLFPAQDVDAGEKKKREPRDWSPCVLRKATPEVEGVYLEHVKIGETLNDQSGRGWLMQEKWALFDRAWTFQEYLLAPRTLLIGHQNLMFQCSKGFYDELLGPIDGIVEEKVKKKNLEVELGKSKYFPASLRTVAKVDSLTDLTVISFMHDWMKIVNEYRARKLSHAKYRIMAFAGIARAFSHLGGMAYLAGTWRKILPLTLLWHVGKKPDTIARAHNHLPPGILIEHVVKVQEYTTRPAPSWSWFSAPIYAFHQLNLLLDDEDALARRKSFRAAPLVCFDDIQWAKNLAFQFSSCAADTFPESTGFSDFADMHVTLSMQTLSVGVNWPADLMTQIEIIRTQSTCIDDREILLSPVFKYHPDNIESGGKDPPKNGVLALIGEYQIVRTAGYTMQRSLVGLVLVPGLEEGKWKRVGAWKLKLRISGITVNSGNIVAVSQRWREYKIISEQWTWGNITIS